MLVWACAVGASLPAGAQSSVSSYSAVCHRSDCSYGATAFWVEPDGPSVGSSVANGWSYIATGTDTSSNFSATASAQASVGGVDRWSASSSAGGYFNSPGTYTGNGVGGVGVILVRDEFTVPSSPGWNGPGWFRVSYRITGAVALSYSETAHVSGQILGAAQSSITFECGSARIGGSGSSRCQSSQFSDPQPGSINLIARLDFDFGQVVDQIVSFDMPVHADLPYAYRLQTSVSSAVSMNALNRSGRIQGSTTADFSNTFTLVDAQLFDAGFSEVSQWSIVSASGFDYSTITTVPEPGQSTLLAVGVALLGWRLRKRSRST